MKNTGKLSIAVVSVLVGVLIILSMRAVDQIGGSANTERAAKLASEINGTAGQARADQQTMAQAAAIRAGFVETPLATNGSSAPSSTAWICVGGT